MHALDGKRIIFVGDSFIYYGNTVTEIPQTVLTQAERSGDHGYFYQLCRARGAEVAVTNWTFGNHSLQALFGGCCAAHRGCDGVDHAAYLTDRRFDAVVFSPSRGAVSDGIVMENVRRVTDFFRAANPDVRFVCLVSSGVRGVSPTGFVAQNTLDHLPDIAALGAKIADWGGLVADLIVGRVCVPDGTETYDKNSFVVCQREGDGFHPNLLAGYLTSLMAYCALTGESAVGQPFAFASDASLDARFDLEKNIAKRYAFDGATTNMARILRSEREIRGLQALADRYLARYDAPANHGDFHEKIQKS